MFPDEAIKAQLARILASKGFVFSEKLRSFLSLIVLHRLDNPEGSLKEYEIGILALGKPDSFDPKQDTTVRQTAKRLRAVLAKYYAGEGVRNPILITMPKGHYIPEFAPIPQQQDAGQVWWRVKGDG